MSPKTQALITLYLTIAVYSLPGIAAVFATSGWTRGALIVGVLSGTVLAVKLGYQKAISELSNERPKGGGGADDTGKTPKQDLPPASPYRPLPIVPKLARPGWVAGLLSVLALAFIMVFLFIAGCTAAQQQQALSDEQLVLNLTNAACTIADATGQAQVIFACQLAEAAEQGAIGVTTVLVPVPKAAAAAFQANAPGARVIGTRALRAYFVRLPADAGASGG